MQTKALFMGLLAMMCSFFGCSAQTQNSASLDGQEFKSLSVQEFEKAIADTAVFRLDVRTAEEYEAGHIENAVNIDVLKDDFESNALKLLPKDRTIALYCRSGKRSKKAAEILVKKGFKVIELSTGFNGWLSR